MVLEESFTLLSTMSPKLLTNNRIKKKGPNVLSLKKPLRRSSMFYNNNCDKKENIILIEESSSETVSTLSTTSDTKKCNINNSTIVISDSENSIVTIEDSFSVHEINKQKCSLSDTKYEKVAEWVSKVNSELDEDFNNISKSEGSLENLLAQKFEDNYKEINVREVPDKDLKEDNCTIDNSMNDKCNSFSLKISFDGTGNSVKVISEKDADTPENPKDDIIGSSEGLEKSIEDILDDIYGGSWRENRDVILQQTERKQEKNYIPFNLKKNTLTDIKGRTNTPCCKDRKVPWINSLKKVCDPDTSSSDDEEDNRYKCSDIRTKLDFEERENISPLLKKNGTPNVNLNKLCNNDYCSEDDLFDDIGQDILNLRDKLLTKLKNNGFSNELDEKNCTPLKEQKIENNLHKKEDADIYSNKKDTNKKSTKRNNVKTEDKKKKNSSRRENINKIIDTDFSDDDTNIKNYGNIKKLETKKYLEESAKQASFLSSLSGSLPKHYCDPSALIFRNNFKSFKDELAKKLFSMYNEKVFNSQIPSDTLIQWNDRMRGSAGFCYCIKTTSSQGRITRKVRIALATKIVDSADRLRDTMIHEMCHAASWIIDGLSDGHGPVWQKWAQKATSVFSELPSIRRCHNYKINTKFTYRCTGCGYSIGRHSKSLDIERKRCGYCYGVFEILINKTNKSGEVQSVPVTPRKEPNAFALFVKKNYAVYKTPQLKHGDVMKLLGQKFSEMKLKTTS